MINKGALSLRTIATLILALTIIAVGTLLIMEVSTPINLLDEKTHSTITEALSNVFGGGGSDFEQVTGEFKASRIAKMVRKCWRGDREKSKICYVLRGTMDATEEEVRGKLSNYVSNRLKINSTLASGPLTIKYNKPDNLIVIE